MALRTVPWLTLKRAASSCSLGMAAPDFHSPASRLCSSKALICWYSGLKAGVAVGTGADRATLGDWVALSGATGAAAMRTGKIDAMSNIDPLMTELESTGDVVIMVDTRTTAGTLAVFGSAMPAGTLYTSKEFIAKNPRTVQALTNAMVRALLWIQKATPAQIADAVPPAYLLNNKDLYLSAFAKVREGISPDGLFPKEGVENTLKVLKEFDVATKAATIRLEDTYTNRFVEQALRTVTR